KKGMTFFCLVAKKSADKKNRFVQNYAMFAVRNPVLRRYILTNEVPDLMYHLLVLLQVQILDLTTVIVILRTRHQ
ncbi:TPA: hypothetical protein ACNRVV_004528, partial [Escherichia coli]|nr:hypothetical protein [Escherichia coli]